MALDFYQTTEALSHAYPNGGWVVFAEEPVRVDYGDLQPLTDEELAATYAQATGT